MHLRLTRGWIHGLAMPESEADWVLEAEKLTLHTYSCWLKFSFDVIQLKIDGPATNLMPCTENDQRIRLVRPSWSVAL